MNIHRRTLLHSLWLGALPIHAWGKSAPNQTTWLMPDENHRHVATWMAYGATAQTWGTTGKYGASRMIARADLLRIAVNLSRFETVNMLVSHQQDLQEIKQLLAKAKHALNQDNHTVYTADNVFSTQTRLPEIEAGGKINFIICPINDLWVRNTAPVFVKNASGKIGGVNFNFNGWGQADTGATGWKKDPQKRANGILDQIIRDDQKIADFIIRHTGVERLNTWLVMEGGGIEVNGMGTAICTESCILNPNRNPNRSKSEVEQELHRLLGVKKVIWLKGRTAQDITDGHVDFYARFVNENTVLYALDNDPQSPDYAVTRENERLLSQARTANGQPLKLIALPAPDFATVKHSVSQRQWRNQKSQFNADSFAMGYIGYYVTDKCVLMAQFSDEKANRHAYQIIQKAYPNHVIMQIATDGLANGGGTIHCATQQQIA